jgi:hypothetical protein
MSERPEDLHDPNFIAYLRQSVGLPIRPDREDYDGTVAADTTEAQAHQYRLAQARKMVCLYRAWKASQK